MYAADGWAWMLKIEGATLSAEFFHKNKNRSCSDAASFSFCGITLWTLRVSHCIVMVCVEICMFAVAVIASQLCGHAVI